MKRLSLWMLVVLATACCTPFASAADWPTWRCDVQRTAASAENLPDELHLQWVRDLPPVVPAWPNESRLHFDTCYEPVVAGKTLLVGSPNDGSVTAFQTENGAVQWKFFSDGPVRFAPVAWKEKVYFGSDDGYLYCRAVRDGKLLWKSRVAPADRPERWHLGNNRLISMWPVRGGPVLADGTIYAGAGLWPTMGVYVVALDAETGRLRWRNGEISYLEKVRIDHNIIKSSALSPQGYLLVVGEKLLVPNGRSMPAALDRATGKVLDYVQGYRNGDCRVTASGNYIYVGRDGVVDQRTFREVNSRWASLGKNAPGPEEYRRAHLFEATLYPYKFITGCSARSALTGSTVYDLYGGTFLACDTTHPKLSEYPFGPPSEKQTPTRWDPPLLWKAPTDLAPKQPGDSAIIRAGNRLYGHTGGSLFALDLPSGEGASPRVAWKQALHGPAAELLAADGKLFVVNGEGRIACFGPQAGSPKTYRLAVTPLVASANAAPHAADILKQTGASEGYCLLLGLGQEGLAEQLLLQSKLKLIAVDADPQRVNRLRQRLIAAGLYGSRADLFCAQPEQFSFPPYLANLIVAEYPRGDNASASRFVTKVFNVLRPYGGTAFLSAAGANVGPISNLPPGTVPIFAAPSRSDGGRKWDCPLPRAEVAQTAGAVLVRRVGALPDSAPWTHEFADAAVSYYSRDRCVRPPLAVLWYGDGPDHGFWMWHAYDTGLKPQVVGGRLFAWRSGVLTCYDAYTGRLLWTAKTDRVIRYASLADGVYVAGGNRCAVLDPATGRPLRTYPFEMEPGRAAYVTDIRVTDEVIVIAACKKSPSERGIFWDATAAVVLDRASGRTLWVRRSRESFHHHAMAAVEGTVFLIEAPSRVKVDKSPQAAKTWQPPASTIFALESRSGNARWSAAMPNDNHPEPTDSTAGIWPRDGWLGYCRELGILLAGKTNESYAFDARDGKQLWHKPIGQPPMIVCGERFLTQQGEPFDTRTGKSLGHYPWFSKGGCNYAVANEYLILFRDASASYVDQATRKKQDVFAARSGCDNSLIAADGLLNVPCFSVGCVCNYPIQTCFALVHMPGWDPVDAAAPRRDRQ
jgi:outer membrane protein assembly factor BamB